MAEHTPGEWQILAPRRLGKHWSVGVPMVTPKGQHGHYIIARIDNGAPGDTLKTEGANARLIAAAPDLLAACNLWDEGFADGDEFTQEQFLKWVNDNRRAARAAIAKATEPVQ